MKGERPSSSPGVKSLARLLPFARPYAWQFVGVIALVIVFNASSVMQPYLVKIAIDQDISSHHPNPRGLLDIAALYIGVVVAGVAANYLQITLLQRAGQSVIRSIRVGLFQHIERQSMRFFDRRAVGALVANVSNDTETVNQFFTNFFLSMIRDGLSIIMILIAMFRLDVRMGLFSLVLVPIIFAVAAGFRGALRRRYQRTRTLLASMVAFLAENLAGMRITQLFRQEARQAQKFRDLAGQHRDANIREYFTSVWFNRTFEMLGNLSVAAVVYIGGAAVLGGSIPFGTLYAFIRYIQQFFQPINAMTQQWNTLQSAMVAAERIGQILEIEPDVVNPERPISLPADARGRVEFRRVTFGYDPRHPVLRDISFVAEPGWFVGIVGPTGAGKSSLMSLLLRFYDPDEGDVLLDGVPIPSLAQDALHRFVGIVQQEVHLFTGTIRDNIRMFRSDISDARVEEAARAVGADRVIAKLPDGYDTFIYGRGANLSMGERQLIAFARIVALDPRVLILDEATANLDSQTEQWVQQGLRAASQGRTTLVIAHRLATIRHADQILVLDHGRIVERGRHDELVRLGGLYARLHAESGVESRLFS
ncbi:ABC transporter transmembrane domain-containing protein [Alicyclobacillus mali (ex Roth et al. 2021)]|uniref:ABC transporter transmembrane domain-containing protein n=1 Tax=Alicyclobacillus mali (ex Roth et al. 2021) TaxID=1123961 RepID=UPI001A8F6F9B